MVVEMFESLQGPLAGESLPPSGDFRRPGRGIPDRENGSMEVGFMLRRRETGVHACSPQST
jgi:hypothetical protein